MAQEVETKRLNEDFEVEMEQLIELVELYRNRKFDEDFQSIKENYQGAEGLAQKLKSNIKDGLSGDDFEERDLEYGSNK
jgi:hypothetical protein